MVPIARRNLLAEKGRLIMSVAGVAFAVLLVMIVLSLYRGWSGIGRLIERLPGDVWVAQAGNTGPFNSSSHLPSDALDDLRDLPGVAAVMPVYAREMAFQRGGSELRLYFMALETPADLPLPAETSERFFPEQGTVYIDTVFSRESGVGLGDEIDVLGTKLTVARVSEGGNAVLTQFAFIHPADARAIFALPGMVNFFLITAAPGTEPRALEDAVHGVLPKSDVRTGDEFAGEIAKQVESGFLPVVSVLVAIGFTVGGAVIGLTTYTATIEKSRDFGVLKALGASGAYLYRIVITQSLIVGIAGFAIGAAASALTATYVKRVIPEFITDLRATDAAIIFGGALLMSVAASYWPVRRINSIDPAMVFRA